MTAKHPEGPYSLEVGKNRCFHEGNRVAITLSGEDNGEPYTVTVAEVWPADHDLDIAVGKLFAAAPDLLAALWEMLHEYEPASSKDYPDAVVLARAAIAKARDAA